MALAIGLFADDIDMKTHIICRKSLYLCVIQQEQHKHEYKTVSFGFLSRILKL